jgi:hypothetical protein
VDVDDAHTLPSRKQLAMQALLARQRSLRGTSSAAGRGATWFAGSPTRSCPDPALSPGGLDPGISQMKRPATSHRPRRSYRAAGGFLISDAAGGRHDTRDARGSGRGRALGSESACVSPGQRGWGHARPEGSTTQLSGCRASPARGDAVRGQLAADPGRPGPARRDHSLLAPPWCLHAREWPPSWL